MAWDESIETSLRPVQENTLKDNQSILNMRLNAYHTLLRQTIYPTSFYILEVDERYISKQKAMDAVSMVHPGGSLLPLGVSIQKKTFELSSGATESLVQLEKMAHARPKADGLIKMDSNMQSKPSQKNG